MLSNYLLHVCTWVFWKIASHQHQQSCEYLMTYDMRTNHTHLNTPSASHNSNNELIKTQICLIYLNLKWIEREKLPTFLKTNHGHDILRRQQQQSATCECCLTVWKAETTTAVTNTAMRWPLVGEQGAVGEAYSLCACAAAALLTVWRRCVLVACANEINYAKLASKWNWNRVGKSMS